jgi:hypothetical protein
MALKSIAFPHVEHQQLETFPVEGTVAGVMDDPEKRKAYVEARRAEVPLLRAEIVRLVSEANTLDLLWHANWLEIARIQQLTNIAPSDIAGQLRYLRSILVARPLTSGHQPCTHEAFRSIMDLIARLWRATFESRMIDLLAGPKGTRKERQAETAGLMALIQAGETEVSYPELAWTRLERIVTPFDEDIVIPAFGGGIADLQRAFFGLARHLEDAVDAARRRYLTLDRVTGLPPVTPSMVPDPAQNPGSMFCLKTDTLSPLIRPIRVDRFLEHFATPFGTTPAIELTPTDNPLVKTKPFAFVDSSLIVLTDPLYFLYAPKYVVPTLFTSARSLTRLRRRRDLVLEEDGLSTLAKMVPAHRQYANFFVQHTDGRTREHDGLLVRSSVGFVVECKAKPLRSFVRTDANVQKALDDFGDSIQHGYDQGARLAALLRTRPVDIRDERGKLLGTVGPLSRTYVIVVLDSSAKTLGTNLEPWLEAHPDIGYPWVIDQDTLTVVSTKLSGFKSVCRFLDWRSQLHGRVSNEDEACFAGFFLQHGAQRFPGDAAMALDTNYSDIFDEDYFRRRGLDPPRVPFDARPTITTMIRDKKTIELGVGQLRDKRR